VDLEASTRTAKQGDRKKENENKSKTRGIKS
jgi:hypothetical protein